MASGKKRFWKSFILFLVIEVLFTWAALFCWGFIGKVSSQRFSRMISYSTQAQKQTLCNALNFYYNKGLAKYTTGILLRCDPETDSMIEQFMWFHRNTLTYYFKDNASYHEILISTLEYFDLLEDIDFENVSTWYLEQRLVNWHKEQNGKSLTDKDKNSLLLTLLDTGGTFLLSTSSPVGVSISALNLLHKAGSDPAKCVPAIVVFKQQRENKFLWTMLFLSFLNFGFTYLITLKKRKS